MKPASIKPVRCAIYTRVSTEHGLDQEFNSLDAQYDAASAYIKSQVHAGWTLIKSRYDDGGYSGGSTDRPHLQRLLDHFLAEAALPEITSDAAPPESISQRRAGGAVRAPRAPGQRHRPTSS